VVADLSQSLNGREDVGGGGGGGRGGKGRGKERGNTRGRGGGGFASQNGVDIEGRR